MAPIRVSPIQVQANDSFYMVEDSEEADDFHACIIEVDVTCCELEHSVIRILPAEVHHSLLQ